MLSPNISTLNFNSQNSTTYNSQTDLVFYGSDNDSISSTEIAIRSSPQVNAPINTLTISVSTVTSVPSSSNNLTDSVPMLTRHRSRQFSHINQDNSGPASNSA